MGILIYIVKETFRGLFAAKLMTFVSIITIGASLFFMSLIGLGIFNINGLLKKTSDQSDMAVYLKDEFSSDKKNVESLTGTISSLGQVKKVGFIDKDSAMSKFSKVYGSEMLDAVSGNPLPASIEVYVIEKYRTVNAIRELQGKIESLAGVESVRYSREWIDLVERFRMYFFIGAAVLIIVMLLVLHIMISNTIKLTIYARQELVRNMHLVGATRFFINTPFILEGMMQGVLGACVSVIALTIVKIALNHIPVLWGPYYLPVLIILTGAFFGWIGSQSAVRKFLV